MSNLLPVLPGSPDDLWENTEPASPPESALSLTQNFSQNSQPPELFHLVPSNSYSNSTGPQNTFDLTQNSLHVPVRLLQASNRERNFINYNGPPLPVPNDRRVDNLLNQVNSGIRENQGGRSFLPVVDNNLTKQDQVVPQ